MKKDPIIANPRLAWRYEVRGHADGRVRRYFGSIAAAHEALMIGELACVSAEAAPGDWQTIFTAFDELDEWAGVQALAEELDARRSALRARRRAVVRA